jgi:hypothetical protein
LAAVNLYFGYPALTSVFLGLAAQRLAGGTVMTMSSSVGSPLSTLAGGAVRMRRMTFLFETKLLIM